MSSGTSTSSSTGVPAGKKSRSSTAGGSDSIKVICRFRPPRNPGKEHTVKTIGKNTYNLDQFKLNIETGEVNYVSDFQDGKHFAYDKVYGGESTQAQVFDEVASTVDFVMSGFNGAVLAYGQTSAGKSWTMEGPSIWDTEYQGVVPRSVDKLFEEIDKAASTIQFQIVVSYYEIYCEKVRDLLNPSQTNMKIRETKTDGFIVQDVTEVYCTDKESVLRVIEMGKTNRVAAPTLMNAESSRSHSIFSVLVDQQDTASGRHKKGILYLVDLAGSEKVGKTGAKGLRLEEAKNINGSLTSLGMVINALCDNAPHVPFRDSKLTMLLMEALGGNSKTTLVICCTPEHDHSPETLSTLRFGERAKRIKTNAKVNEELSVAELKTQLTSAKKELASLVGVLGRTSTTVTEAVTTSSVEGLVPLVDVLKRCLSKSSVKGDSVAVENATTGDAVSLAAAADSAESGLDDLSVSAKQPVKTQEEQMADLKSKLTSLEEEVELEKLKSEQEHEKFIFKETEMAALQATISELEEKLVKANLAAKHAQEAKALAEEQLSAAKTETSNSNSTGNTDSTPLSKQRSAPMNPGGSPGSGGSDSNVMTPPASNIAENPGKAISGPADMSSLSSRESREFLIKLERELVSVGTGFEKESAFQSPDKAPTLQSKQTNPEGSAGVTVAGEVGIGVAGRECEGEGEAVSPERRGLDANDKAEMLRFLNIQDSDLSTSALDSEGNRAYTKEAYETHVRRLMLILDQEQQARLRVEDKLEDARQQLIRQSAKIVGTPGSSSKSKGFLQNLFGGGGGGGGTPSSMSSNPLTSLSNMVTDTLSPGTRRNSVGGGKAEENARRYNYTDRESALAETLEIAQDRIMELVAEIESNNEAQNIVLETKESVLRSLARQNTHLAMERDTLNKKVEELNSKTEQLSSLLRSLQQAQVQPIQPALSGPGAIGNQSFRIGGQGGSRFIGGGEGGGGEFAGLSPKGLRTTASFRMGGKPPIPVTPTHGSIATAGGSPPIASPFAALTINTAAAGGAAISSSPSHNTAVPLVSVPPSMSARAPTFSFSGGGTIQRNRSNRTSPYPPPSASPVHASQSTSLSSSPASSCSDLVQLEIADSDSTPPVVAAVATAGASLEESSSDNNEEQPTTGLHSKNEPGLAGIAEEETE